MEGRCTHSLPVFANLCWPAVYNLNTVRCWRPCVVVGVVTMCRGGSELVSNAFAPIGYVT